MEKRNKKLVWLFFRKKSAAHVFALMVKNRANKHPQWKAFISIKMATLFEQLRKDIRFVEGLNSCINCGVCTAICPAAAVSDYDPRLIAETLQHGNEAELEQLLKSDTIWLCGECLSCKTRCPRGNTPGYLIQALRALSIETGLFIESGQGQATGTETHDCRAYPKIRLLCLH